MFLNRGKFIMIYWKCLKNIKNSTFVFRKYLWIIDFPDRKVLKKFTNVASNFEFVESGAIMNRFINFVNIFVILSLNWTLCIEIMWVKYKALFWILFLGQYWILNRSLAKISGSFSVKLFCTRLLWKFDRIQIIVYPFSLSFGDSLLKI